MRRMGKGVHSSIKTFYFGLLCTIFTMVYILFDGIELYRLDKIGSAEYPISSDQLISSLLVGFFSWANQESLSLCLTIIKQGTASAFNNIALVVSFMVDTFYFGRTVLPQDIVGTSLIVIFSIAQCLISDKANKKEASERMNSLQNLTVDAKNSGNMELSSEDEASPTERTNDKTHHSSIDVLKKN